MRSKAIVIVLALSTALAVWAATPAKNTPAKKKTSAKKATAKTSAAKGSKAKSTSKAAKSTARKKSKSSQTASTRYRRSSQREPDPSRYKEIQQSLADKGYFNGPVNGNWGSDSVEALKRFQRDQNIGDDGKLGSLSLIALGLGPKRGGIDAGGPEKSDSSDAAPPPP